MPRRSGRKRVAKNIYRDAAGLSITVKVGTGARALQRERRYPPDTPIKTMRAWEQETRRELRKAVERLTRATLRQEVPGYLDRVREALASFPDRQRDVEAWLPRFGDRRRQTLKVAELDEQLQHWRTIDGLAASTVNHRRDALSDLFRVLDGKDATNPVKACVWFARAKSTPKGISRRRIARVLGAMDPDHKTRWRLTLIHWTGMRPSQQGRLAGSDDFFLDARAFELVVDGVPRRVPAILVPAGKGGDRVLFPLTPEGEWAAREFLRVDAFWRPPAPRPGQRPRATWSCPSAYKRIVAAAKQVGETPFTVYAIKHSFASALLQSGTDAAVIQAMLGHADIKSTLVYARSVDATHVAALERLRAADRRQYDEQLWLPGLVGAGPWPDPARETAGTHGWHADRPGRATDVSRDGTGG